MASIRYDGQSLMVDERRIWLVSAALHYPRIPHELWRQRIRAAKQAGCNTIETYVFWNAHEPRPGKFDFEDNLDLRSFVQIIGEEGMYCIFRPGPYICAEWDAGGHPAWLWEHESNSDPMKFREFNGPYLQACQRYLTAVMEQVVDLQITRDSDPPGPIVVTQVENEWFSNDQTAGKPYFEALTRSLRSNGCDTPLIACNNLWYQVDGAIDTWNASQNLPQSLRQLTQIQPDAPRLVTEYWSGWFDRWGGDHASTVDAQTNLYRLAGILATGSQYNFFMFHGGTNFGFYGGRTVGEQPTFMTTSYDYDAPLSETGGRTPKYFTSKRISTFASQFGHVFAHLDNEFQPVCVLPKEGTDHPPAVIHQSGSQGSVVFILKSEKDRSSSTTLLLPNGLQLPVPTGKDRATWVLLDTPLSGVATLDLTNLCPYAWIDQRMLVLYGPAGADGVVGLDGALYQFKVPSGSKPHLETHEGIIIVVLNTQTADHSYVTSDSLVIGADGLDVDDAPLPLKGFSQITTVHSDGSVTSQRSKPPAKPTAPRPGGWTYAPSMELVNPEATGFEPIKQPLSHEKLGCNFGYGWYHLKDMPAAAKLSKLLVPMPGCGDRLHFFQQEKLVATHGLGPGFDQKPFKLQGKHDLTVLADNLGRFNYGPHILEDTKGLSDHLYAVKAAKVAKPKLSRQRFPDVSSYRQYVPEVRSDDRPAADVATWNVRLTVKAPVMMELPPIGCLAALIANDQVIRLHRGDGSRGLVRYVFSARDKMFDSGSHTLSLHLHNPDVDLKKLLDQIKFYQVEPVTDGKTQWYFKSFALPDDDAFESMPARTSTLPAFYRTQFNVKSNDTPLCVELHGMSKGQLYLNGHNVGRYFVQTAQGKAVPPQLRYYLPEPWLLVDQPNVLILFDEHGKQPGKVKFSYVKDGLYT